MRMANSTHVVHALGAETKGGDVKRSGESDIDIVRRCKWGRCS